ncbi:hypothetical protein GCM10022236_21350 [Microlunatus ginsengisoli]|uniref:Uncharacterized protein n=1 Tax=Microlunatus ginsengisoli TaxID=363863 RepID=A0ABP6ZVQ7_9ACTN
MFRRLEAPGGGSPCEREPHRRTGPSHPGWHLVGGTHKESGKPEHKDLDYPLRKARSKRVVRGPAAGRPACPESGADQAERSIHRGGFAPIVRRSSGCTPSRLPAAGTARSRFTLPGRRTPPAPASRRSPPHTASSRFTPPAPASHRAPEVWSGSERCGAAARGVERQREV